MNKFKDTTKDFHNTLFLMLFLLIIVSFVYVKYLIYGGFSNGDDITLTLRAINEETVFSFKHYERPVSYILFNYFHNLFKDKIFLYIFLSIFSWIFLVYLNFLILRNYLNKSALFIFILLSSFPFFSSTIVTGVHLFCSYTISLIFWSLSVFFSINFIKNNNLFYYFIGCFFLFLAFFTNVIFLPLLIFNIFLPVLYEYKINNNFNFKNLFLSILKFLAPVFILSIFFISYKIIGKDILGRNIIYGIAPLTIKSFFQAIYFFVAIFVEVPILLISSLKNVLNLSSILISILIMFYFIILRKTLSNTGNENNKKHFSKIELLFLFIALLSLVSSTLIFFISNYPAQTFGYYNRMMMPAFVSFSIILSILLSKLICKQFIILVISFSILWILSMFVQINNHIEGWKLREYIISDIIDNLKNEIISEKTVLIANVPFYNENNYNNEELFMTKWSFSDHIILYGGPSVTVWPVCYRSISDKNFYPGHNIMNNLHKIKNDSEIIYYEYVNKQNTKLIKIKDKDDLIKVLMYSTQNKINFNPIIMQEKIRIFFKNFVKNYFIA